MSNVVMLSAILIVGAIVAVCVTLFVLALKAID